MWIFGGEGGTVEVERVRARVRGRDDHLQRAAARPVVLGNVPED